MVKLKAAGNLPFQKARPVKKFSANSKNMEVFVTFYFFHSCTLFRDHMKFVTQVLQKGLDVKL